MGKIKRLDTTESFAECRHCGSDLTKEGRCDATGGWPSRPRRACDRCLSGRVDHEGWCWSCRMPVAPRLELVSRHWIEHGPVQKLVTKAFARSVWSAIRAVMGRRIRLDEYAIRLAEIADEFKSADLEAVAQEMMSLALRRKYEAKRL